MRVYPQPAQVMAFVDSVMLAVQLNVTLVLPRFYKHYEYLAVSQEQENEFWTQVLCTHTLVVYLFPVICSQRRIFC